MQLGTVETIIPFFQAIKRYLSGRKGVQFGRKEKVTEGISRVGLDQVNHLVMERNKRLEDWTVVLTSIV